MHDFFPGLGFRYGVVAPANFSKAASTGSMGTDDEDSNNKNRPQSQSDVVSGLMDISKYGTRYHLALVELPPPPPRPCERTRTC